MKSVMIASETLMLGHRKIMVAGGMECMSQSPHYAFLRKPAGFGDVTFPDSIKHDGLTDVYNKILMGSCTEKVVTDLNISRQAQDEFAIESYNRARKAQESGVLGWEIADVIIEDKKGSKKISHDEECQKFMPDKFPGLKPAFAKNGTITAANSSKLNDGACAFVLMTEQTAKEHGLQPLARIVSFGDAAVAPIDFGIAPAKACQEALNRAGLKMKDIEYHEINEAFSAVALANMKLLDLDHNKVNVHGGAVALGHPIGASGARIILSLINVLRTHNGKLGMASICNGGGGASAIIIEKF
jgi:acetyl-CoA C-acetyltransferase